MMSVYKYNSLLFSVIHRIKQNLKVVFKLTLVCQIGVLHGKDFFLLLEQDIRSNGAYHLLLGNKADIWEVKSLRRKKSNKIINNI